MCTRYVLLEEHYRRVLERLGIASPAPFPSRYNIGPGRPLPAIRARASDGQLEVVPLSWGWQPPWADGPAGKLVNVRAETVAQRRPLREALQTRRCVLPATGFYEWQKLGSARQPFLFRRTDGLPFGLAAIAPDAPSASAGSGFAVITTEPDERVRPVHDRMPVMLAMDEMAEWLSPSQTGESLLARLRRPTHSVLTSLPVDRRMNNVRYEAPDCIAPVELHSQPAPARDHDDGQFTLGL